MPAIRRTPTVRKLTDRIRNEANSISCGRLLSAVLHQTPDKEPRLTWSDVFVERRGSTAWLMFDRAPAHDAVRLQTMQELCQALDEAVDDPGVRVIVLGSRGRHFVAGAEFSFLDRLTELPASEVKSDIYRFFQGATRRLYACPKPTIAAIAGAAITVGCELAIACDFRVVTPKALFQESWIKLGLLPPLGGMKLLPALVGFGMAKEMVLRGRPVGGEEAVRIGLASELASVEDLEARVDALAEQLAAAAPNAYREAKAGLHRGLESSMESEWQAGATAQSLLIASDDFREGLAAVKEKRSPTFTGK